MVAELYTIHGEHNYNFHFEQGYQSELCEHNYNFHLEQGYQSKLCERNYNFHIGKGYHPTGKVIQSRTPADATLTSKWRQRTTQLQLQLKEVQRALEPVPPMKLTQQTVT